MQRRVNISLFLLGSHNGRGVHRCANNGDVYEGEYQQDKRHGRGVLRFGNGKVYEGEWSNGKRHGRGVYRKADALHEITTIPCMLWMEIAR